MKYVIISVLLLSGCVSISTIPTDYRGADAGKLVIAIGASKETYYSSYSLLFKKRIDQVSQFATGRLIYFQGNLFYSQDPDYINDKENGVILISSLPSGDYDIFNFDLFDFNNIHYSSRTPISIPFTIKPNQVTYIGNYQANSIPTKNSFGMTSFAWGYFVTENRANQDLEIARKKDPSISKFDINSAPAAHQIKNQFFRSSP